MNAFEDSKNGLLVKHLQPLLHKNIGIDMLVSELKEGKEKHCLNPLLHRLFLDHDIISIQEKF